MKLLNFFKRNRKNFPFSQEKCKKVHERGKELTSLLHPQIKDILSKYYQNELNSSHFIEKKENSKDVFEVACVGLSLVKFIVHIEKTNGDAEQVKKCLKAYQDIYAEIQKGCIYNHVMKYISDYKYFIDSDAPAQINDQEIMITCFTGAWIIRYYIGEEATIQFDSSIEIGNMIQETICELWDKKSG